jgi:uncharacterized protein (TIGR01777 family)
MAFIAVTGASGLIGRALVQELTRRGHQVSRMVRRPAGRGEISWDPARGILEPGDLEGVDAVVHLAGENVAARWTGAKKQRIRDSRVRSTRLLSETLGRLRRPPRVLVSASAVGIYGNRGDEILTEVSPPGDPGRSFLVAVAQEWEAAAEPARAVARVVHPRFGIVLSPQGGALQKMLPAFRIGLGGRVGSGSQWVSWVSLDDAVGAVIHSLFSDTLQGAVNVTAPVPLTNSEFTRILGRVLSRPTVFPVPATVLRLALGEMANDTLLTSARVVPTQLLKSGYRFQHSDLESALRHVLGREPQ